jgi:hypothetical protein
MTPLAFVAALGIVAGLVAFGRGLAAYRRGLRITGIASSPIASIAAGEVRVSGTVEPDAVTLVSPLQSEACVYFRASIEEDAGRDSHTVFSEERGVGFRVRDASGSIRVFPQGARWEVPTDLDDSGGMVDATPAGVRLNTGPTIAGVPEESRDAQVRALLTVRDPGALDAGSRARDVGPGLGVGGLAAATGRRRYVEARIDLGDAVTVIGWAVPFGTLADPAAADAFGGIDAAMADDPAIAADLAEARAAGLLAASPEEAWGNAAIPGFGIGRPVTTPELDVDADPLPPGDPELARQAERRFEIPDDELVVAVTADQPLAVFDGMPDVAAGREQGRFILGLLGAVLAIVSAITLAYLLRGGPFP